MTLLVPKYMTNFFQNGVFQVPQWPVIAGMLLLVTASGAISALQNYQLQSTGEDIVRDARLALSKHLLRLPIREYDQRDSGDLLSRVSNDTSQLRNAFMQCTSASHQASSPSSVPLRLWQCLTQSYSAQRSPCFSPYSRSCCCPLNSSNEQAMTANTRSATLPPRSIAISPASAPYVLQTASRTRIKPKTVPSLSSPTNSPPCAMPK